MTTMTSAIPPRSPTIATRSAKKMKSTRTEAPLSSNGRCRVCGIETEEPYEGELCGEFGCAGWGFEDDDESDG